MDDTEADADIEQSSDEDVSDVEATQHSERRKRPNRRPQDS